MRGRFGVGWDGIREYVGELKAGYSIHWTRNLYHVNGNNNSLDALSCSEVKIKVAGQVIQKINVAIVI